jgi:hypothetical protein
MGSAPIRQLVVLVPSEGGNPSTLAPAGDQTFKDIEKGAPDGSSTETSRKPSSEIECLTLEKAVAAGYLEDYG